MGVCLPALSHCLGGQIHKWADFCTEQFSSMNFHIYLVKWMIFSVCTWCLGVINYLSSWLHVCEKGFGYPCFTGGRQGMSWLVGCACAIIECSVEWLLKLFKSCKEGCFSLCCALFLEDSRANCCSHRTGRNIAFAHFCSVFESRYQKLLVFQSVIMV